MNPLENIFNSFRQGNSLIRLIFINASLFVVLGFLEIVLQLFKFPSDFLWSYLSLPADLSQLLFRFWTPISYMFLHEGFIHLLFNMLSLYWFGKLFTIYFSEKQLVGLYLLGGCLGAVFYLLAFNIFPYYSPILSHSLLLGASGSIMAIIVASATKSPNMEMQMLFVGRVKLKYIALIAVLMSLFGITSNNGGGQLAHLGGALAGYYFVVSLRQGRDLTKGINNLLSFFVDLFSSKKLKAKPNNSRKTPMSDAEYNVNKANKMANIDRILDKIKTSGYESLSADEKKKLFEQGSSK
jgi:membrane associated rhomboid family serine protease